MWTRWSRYMRVHLEATDDATATDSAAKKYFGALATEARPEHKALADYFRSRKIGCVIFAVDECLTGRQRVTSEEVVRFASDNAGVTIPFASIDPHRGSEGVREAKRLLAEGIARGLKLHPPVQRFSPDDKLAYPLYEVFAERAKTRLVRSVHVYGMFPLSCSKGEGLPLAAPDRDVVRDMLMLSFIP
jgi:predicted TIM-barrel fold metal-dependent hydrolase